MSKSKKRFYTLLLLLMAAFAAVEFGNRAQWLDNFTDQARQSKTHRYYDDNQGGFEGSAAEWTRAVFH